jgi:hypothetical protein
MALSSCGGMYTAYTADGLYHRPVAQISETDAQRTAPQGTEPSADFDYYDPNASSDFRPWEVPSSYQAPGFTGPVTSVFGSSYGGFGGFGPSWGYDPFDPWTNPYSNFGWNCGWGMPGYGGGWGAPMGTYFPYSAFYPYGNYYPYGGYSPYGGWPVWGGNDYRPVGQPTSLPRPNRSGTSPGRSPIPSNGRSPRTAPDGQQAPEQKPSERSRWIRDVEQFFEGDRPESSPRPSRSGGWDGQAPSRPSRDDNSAPSRPSPSPSGGGGRSGGSPQPSNPRTR